MREAETESREGKRKNESLWPIFKITFMTYCTDGKRSVESCMITASLKTLQLKCNIQYSVQGHEFWDELYLSGT